MVANRGGICGKKADVRDKAPPVPLGKEQSQKLVGGLSFNLTYHLGDFSETMGPAVGDADAFFYGVVTSACAAAAAWRFALRGLAGAKAAADTGRLPQAMRACGLIYPWPPQYCLPHRVPFLAGGLNTKHGCRIPVFQMWAIMLI